MRAPAGGGALQLLLATTFQLLGGCCADTMLRSQDNGTPTSSGEVIRWVDVYNRSFCQPKETMVPVSAEHPGEVEHLLVPSCVPLRRCAGCCADEELQCVPVQMHVVVMEVMKTRFPRSHLGQMPFVEHSACECRPKKLSKDQTQRPACLPCPDRRRHLDPQTCECRCRRRPQRCRARGLELNEHSCRESQKLWTTTPITPSPRPSRLGCWELSSTTSGISCLESPPLARCGSTFWPRALKTKCAEDVEALLKTAFSSRVFLSGLCFSPQV